MTLSMDIRTRCINCGKKLERRSITQVVLFCCKECKKEWKKKKKK